MIPLIFDFFRAFSRKVCPPTQEAVLLKIPCAYARQGGEMPIERPQIIGYFQTHLAYPHKIIKKLAHAAVLSTLILGGTGGRTEKPTPLCHSNVGKGYPKLQKKNQKKNSVGTRTGDPWGLQPMSDLYEKFGYQKKKKKKILEIS